MRAVRHIRAASALLGATLTLACGPSGSAPAPDVVAEAIAEPAEDPSRRPLLGPFSTMDEACAALSQTELMRGTEPCPACVFDCRRSELLGGASGLASPLDQLSLFVSLWRDPTAAPAAASPFTSYLNLAVGAEGAWWIAADLAQYGDGTHVDGSFEALQAGARPVAGEGDAALVVRFGATLGYRYSTTESEWITVIGTDAGGAPSMIAPIAVAVTTVGETAPSQEGSQKIREETNLDWRFDEGALIVDAARTRRTVGDAVEERTDAQTTRHALDFR